MDKDIIKKQLRDTITRIYRLTEASERDMESKNNIKSSLDSLVPWDMPRKMVEAMKRWPVVSKSPYSNSFYDITNKGWDDTGNDKFHRISDHWNFKTKHDNRIHCKLNKRVPVGWWTLAIYDANKGEYSAIESLPRMTPIEAYKPGTVPPKHLWQDIFMATSSQLSKALGGGDQRGAISALIHAGYFSACKVSDIDSGLKLPQRAQKEFEDNKKKNGSYEYSTVIIYRNK